MSALRAIDKFSCMAIRRLPAGIAGFLATCLLLACGCFPAYGAGPVSFVAQITMDDDGLPLDYPTAVYYDPTEEEIYLVNGISGRVIVYGPDFFPEVSIGLGRGIGAPRGGVVLPNGQVFISQARTRRSPANRITVLNGAFFIDRDIVLDEIPEASGFVPRSVAVSRDGIIYVAGDNSRGLLVLDQEGAFLRWLKPTDKIRDREAIAEAAREADAEERALSGEDLPEPLLEGDAPEDFVDIPEEFRPRNLQDETSSGIAEGHGPVKVNFVNIDQAGNLYLLSAETGKVYIYGPDETFLFTCGQKGGSPGQLSQPRGVAIDEERGLIYVVDYMRHSVLVYNMSGKYLFEFGGRGRKPGWLNFPVGIAVNRHGQVIIADQFNKRVQVLEVDFDSLFPMYGVRLSDENLEDESDPADLTIPEDTPSGQQDGAEESEAEEMQPEETETPDEYPMAPEEIVEETIVPVAEIPEYADEELEGMPPPGEDLPDSHDSREEYQPER